MTLPFWKGFLFIRWQFKLSMIFQNLVKQEVFKASNQSMRMGIVFGISGA
jgi:hypothetical protein